MDNKKINNFSIYPMWNEALLSSMTSMVESYQGLLDSISWAPVMDNILEVNKQFSQSMLSTLDTTALSSTLTTMIDLNVKPIIELYTMSPAFTNMVQQLTESLTMTVPHISEEYIEIFSEYEKIFSQIDSFSEIEIETMLNGTDYTREEIFEDINLFKQEVIETSITDSDSENMLPEDRANEFLKRHPALAHILYVMQIILLVLSGVQTVDDIVVPGIQKAIVTIQGNEDIFFIKVESAKVYVKPSSSSEVIQNILYGEQVTVIESVKLWDKVIYIDEEGEEIIGWIAKRNLMTFQDYQFNSSDLYDIE